MRGGGPHGGSPGSTPSGSARTPGPPRSPGCGRWCTSTSPRCGPSRTSCWNCWPPPWGWTRTISPGTPGTPPGGFNVNWYPGTATVGPPLPGQFRIGAHTDFGTVTVLDREPGAGGLQIHTDRDGWQDAPYDPAALTVNIGDLLARWTGDRWRAGRHRVLPPPADAPAEELVSLVYFYECDPHTRVESLPAPLGRVTHEPVDSHAYLRSRLDAITVPLAPGERPG
ncbi:hypothetical protein GCM10020254_11930 [Streptomyces goshikiensis]